MVIVRGVKSSWHQTARKRIMQWLKLPGGTVVVFEDDGSKKGSRSEGSYG